MTNTETTAMLRGRYENVAEMLAYLASRRTAADMHAAAHRSMAIALNPRGRFGLTATSGPVVTAIETVIRTLEPVVAEARRIATEGRDRGLAYGEIGELPGGFRACDLVN